MVASPTTLITLHKANSADAASLDASFRKSLSTTKRVIALSNNSLFAGFYVVTPHKRIRPIFQPQRCTLTDPNTGVEQEFLVGHGSNDPQFLHAEYVTVAVNVAGTFDAMANVDFSRLNLQRTAGFAIAGSGVKQWVDPLVGLRLRHQLSVTRDNHTRLMLCEETVAVSAVGADFEVDVAAAGDGKPWK